MTIRINPQVDEEESSRTGLTLSSSRALDSNYFSSASPACILTASVLSNSLRLYGLQPAGSSVHGILQARILEWVACHALLQGIFLTQGSNSHLLCLCIGRWVLYHQCHLRSLLLAGALHKCQLKQLLFWLLIFYWFDLSIIDSRALKSLDYLKSHICILADRLHNVSCFCPLGLRTLWRLFLILTVRTG